MRDALDSRGRVGRSCLESLVPHGGDMCLWDEVLEWNAGSLLLRSEGHHAETHPLRVGGRLRAVHLCEYGAQAMAVHGGLRAGAEGATPRPGMLVALRGVTLHVDYLETLDGPLECRATLLADGDSSQQYAFEIHHAGELLADGRAAVMLGQAAPGQTKEFP